MVGGGYAGIDRRLHQHLLDLVAGQAVVQRAADMDAEFAPGAERTAIEMTMIERSRLCKARPVPDVVPGRAGDELLPLAVEGVTPALGLVDIGGPSTARRVFMPLS
jgi:hypothetical protein